MKLNTFNVNGDAGHTFNLSELPIQRSVRRVLVGGTTAAVAAFTRTPLDGKAPSPRLAGQGVASPEFAAPGDVANGAGQG